MKTVIVIALLIGLSITIATIVVGTLTFEGTVAKDAYREGLQWDAIRRARQESGWTATVEPQHIPLGRSELHVRLLDRTGHPLRGASVELLLTKPETSQHDYSAAAHEVEDGLFAAAVELTRSGRWQVRISATRGERTVVFEETLSAINTR